MGCGSSVHDRDQTGSQQGPNSESSSPSGSPREGLQPFKDKIDADKATKRREFVRQRYNSLYSTDSATRPATPEQPIYAESSSTTSFTVTTAELPRCRSTTVAGNGTVSPILVNPISSSRRASARPPSESPPEYNSLSTTSNQFVTFVVATPEHYKSPSAGPSRRSSFCCGDGLISFMYGGPMDDVPPPLPGGADPQPRDAAEETLPPPPPKIVFPRDCGDSADCEVAEMSASIKSEAERRRPALPPGSMYSEPHRDTSDAAALHEVSASPDLLRTGSPGASGTTTNLVSTSAVSPLALNMVIPSNSGSVSPKRQSRCSSRDTSPVGAMNVVPLRDEGMPTRHRDYIAKKAALRLN